MSDQTALHRFPAPSSAARKDSAPAPDPAVEQIFLTPRVIDKRSFEEFSLTLQDLIRQAAGHSRLLQSTKADAGTLEGQLRDTAKELQSRLEKAAKLLPALEQRLTRAERLLEMAVDPAKHADVVEKLIAERMAARAAEFELRLGGAVEQLTARFRAEQEAVEARAREVEARAQDFALKTARAVEELAAQAERQAGGLEARAEELREVLRGELSAVTSRIAEVETQIAETAGHAQETRSILDHHATGILESLKEQARQVETDAGRARADLEHRTAGLLASLATAGETIAARHRDLDAAAARREADLGEHGVKIKDSLDAVSERAGEALARQLESQRVMMGDLEKEIEQRVDRGRVLLDEGLRTLGEEADRGRETLDRHARALTESIESQREAVRDLTREIDDRVRQIEAAAVQGVDRVELSAARAGDELSSRAGELLAGIRGETHSIAARQVEIESGLHHRAESLADAASAAAAEVERRRAEAVSELDAQRGYVVEQKAQIEDVLNQAERVLGPLIGRGQEMLNNLDSRLQIAARQLDWLEGGKFEELRGLIARAEAAGGDGPGLAGALMKAEAAARGAEFAARQFEAMKGQAEQARAMLSDAIMAAAGWIDAMEERREAIVKESAG